MSKQTGDSEWMLRYMERASQDRLAKAKEAAEPPTHPTPPKGT